MAPDVVVGGQAKEGPKSKLACYSGSYSDNDRLGGLRKNAATNRSAGWMAQQFGNYGSWNVWPTSGGDWTGTSFPGI